LLQACRTQEEIGKEVGITQGEVSKSIPNGEIAEQNKNCTNGIKAGGYFFGSRRNQSMLTQDEHSSGFSSSQSNNRASGDSFRLPDDQRIAAGKDGERALRISSPRDSTFRPAAADVLMWHLPQLSAACPHRPQTCTAGTSYS
jgi:hypothetical protein